MDGRKSTEVPVPPTSRATAWIRPVWFGLFWRWEIRLRTHTRLTMGGFAFTKASARRQAYSWATARA